MQALSALIWIVPAAVVKRLSQLTGSRVANHKNVPRYDAFFSIVANIIVVSYTQCFHPYTFIFFCFTKFTVTVTVTMTMTVNPAKPKWELTQSCLLHHNLHANSRGLAQTYGTVAMYHAVLK
jgi:hypothetical protein